MRLFYSKSLIALVSAAFLFSGCDKSTEPVLLPGQEVVLAKVSETDITRFDVDRAIKEQLGPGTLEIIDDTTKRKILESLVVTRAFSLEMEKQLTEEQNIEVEQAVKAYKELLLAKQYVTLHSQGVEVTEEKLIEFYEANLNLYGFKKIKLYALLKGKSSEDSNEKQKILKQLDAAKNQKTEQWKSINKSSEGSIAYFSGKLEEKLFKPRLQTILEGLSPNETSNIVFINKTPYLARITDVEINNATEFEKVRADVEKRVQALEAKKQIQRLQDKLLAETNISYTADSAVQ